MAFTVEVKKFEDQNYAVLVITGDLDAASVGEFSAELQPVADNPVFMKVVLDCSGLRFVASAGLRALLSAIKAMTPRKAKLCMAGAPEAVREVLKITGFLNLLMWKTTVEECLA